MVVQEADGLDATAREAVLALAGDPAAATAVVLRAAAPGRQGKFFKDVQRDAAVVQAAKLRPAERASWLRAEVRRLGRKADEAAVASLVDTVGQDLRELAGAVAKLHVAVPPLFWAVTSTVAVPTGNTCGEVIVVAPILYSMVGVGVPVAVAMKATDAEHCPGVLGTVMFAGQVTVGGTGGWFNTNSRHQPLAMLATCPAFATSSTT